MPVIFRERGFRFHFYSYEGSPREPVHVHVARPGGDAKIWLHPEPRVAKSRGLTPQELRWVLEIVTMRQQEIEHAWNIFFA
jgi:hypothetical protein